MPVMKMSLQIFYTILLRIYYIIYLKKQIKTYQKSKKWWDCRPKLLGNPAEPENFFQAIDK